MRKHWQLKGLPGLNKLEWLIGPGGNTSLLVAGDLDGGWMNGWTRPTSSPLIHPVLEASALFLCLFIVLFGVSGAVSEIRARGHGPVVHAVL